MGRQIVHYFVLWVANYQMLRTTGINYAWEAKSFFSEILNHNCPIRKKIATDVEMRETLFLTLSNFVYKWVLTYSLGPAVTLYIKLEVFFFLVENKQVLKSSISDGNFRYLQISVLLAIHTELLFTCVLFFYFSNLVPSDFVMCSEWRAYSFSSLFILDVTTLSQKDHKLFSTTYILCSKKFGN